MLRRLGVARKAASGPVLKTFWSGACGIINFIELDPTANLNAENGSSISTWCLGVNSV